ncbi:MAG TPA: glycosyl hydrolase [Humisphaera sp.]
MTKRSLLLAGVVLIASVVWSRAAAPVPAPAPADKRFTAKQLSFPGKKGVCFLLPPHDAAGRTPAKNDALRRGNLARAEALNVSWNYSWGQHLAEEQPAEREFVPMVFGNSGLGKGDSVKKLSDQLARTMGPQVRAGRVKRLLGLNEPDHKEQGNMTVEQALALWPTLEALNVPLCSPSCANPEGTEATDPANQGIGGNWMPAFMAEADKRGLRVDYVGVHHYGGPGAEAFKAKLKRIHEKYGKRPLLVTEFAVADWKTGGDLAKHRYTPAQVLKFMKEVVPWMERQDWIAGYAWFPFKHDSPQGTSSALFDAKNELTALGRFYRSVTPEKPDGDQTIRVE